MTFTKSAVLWVRRAVANQLRRLRDMRDVSSLNARELADIGVSRQDASTIASGASDTRERIDAMSRRLGVAPGRIAANSWLRVDIARSCALCTKRGECRLWLADHDADIEGHKAFCPNAERFKELQDRPPGVSC